MAAITIRPEHLDGLRHMVEVHFERACEEGIAAVDKLRELIAVGDQVGWDEGDPIATEIELSDRLLQEFVTFAWGAGNETMGDVYLSRVRPPEQRISEPEQRERAARSMLSFHEHVQGERVEA